MGTYNHSYKSTSNLAILSFCWGGGGGGAAEAHLRAKSEAFGLEDLSFRATYMLNPKP